MSTCPRAKLLSGEAWEAARPSVLRALRLSDSAEEYLTEFGECLDTAYHRTTEHIPELEEEMGKVFPSLSMSLDGYVAGLDDELEPLHDWLLGGSLSRHGLTLSLPAVRWWGVSGESVGFPFEQSSGTC